MMWLILVPPIGSYKEMRKHCDWLHVVEGNDNNDDDDGIDLCAPRMEQHTSQLRERANQFMAHANTLLVFPRHSEVARGREIPLKFYTSVFE